MYESAFGTYKCAFGTCIQETIVCFFSDRIEITDKTLLFCHSFHNPTF